MSHKVDESAFNEEMCSIPSFEEREKQMAEKKKLFEESRAKNFQENQERMKSRMRSQHEDLQQSEEPKIEEVDESELISAAGAEEGNEEERKEEIDEEEEEEEEEILTKEESDLLIEEAKEHKQNGNEYYRDERWEAAIAEYGKAISICPKRDPIRAVFYGNRAACWQNLLEYEKVVEDCTAALKLDENYIKVLLRRANAYERLEKPSEALEDYETVIRLEPHNKLSLKAAQRLPQEIKVKQERDKEEMMGKLKEVGNSLLGMVGLSLDNFQFTQDPNTGGYSMNFQNN